MAIVDFSNAVLTPLLYNNTPPYADYYMDFYPYSMTSVYLCDANGNLICDTPSARKIDNKSEYIIEFRGTMTASGSVMYIGNGNNTSGWTNHWKIENVTFSSGDTVYFQVKAALTFN